LLTPQQQAEFVSELPEVFLTIPVRLERASEIVLAGTLGNE
jgi:hypothetical protein